ncbi:hypothetical protein G5V59_11955 [Nocardioides sp. W3-2-3]|uniref:hypothetical protein n=1 Tax=Nocardioides convexus TaxID=2712224 RepID=UPI00241861AE|nr:hypothetical protein [Nocardioides convexus]NHA00504.1 hypothetical protein [Nocardioides convexus]
MLSAFALVAGSAAAVQPAANAVDTDPNHLTVIYDAEGTTHVGNQVDADMPIGPTTISVTIDTIAPLPTPIIDGTMVIPAKTINFDILGIPARAKVTMTQVGKITGTLTKSALAAPGARPQVAGQVRHQGSATSRPASSACGGRSPSAATATPSTRSRSTPTA